MKQKKRRKIIKKYMKRGKKIMNKCTGERKIIPV